MNPSLDYQCLDITKDILTDKYDIATAIEVLEHIHPQELKHFVEAIHSVVADDGYFILTVPHINKSLNPKHYQHFSGKSIVNALSPYFSNFKIIPFDPPSLLMSLLQRVIGGVGKHYIVTNQSLLNKYYGLYIKWYLYSQNERNCNRIAVVCKKIKN